MTIEGRLKQMTTSDFSIHTADFLLDLQAQP